MIIKPKLHDGTVFTIGMTVVKFNGDEIKTDDSYEIVPLSYGGFTMMMLNRKGGFVSVDLHLLYPSQEARIANQVEMLERLKARADHAIEHLKSGGHPTQVMDLLHI